VNSCTLPSTQSVYPIVVITVVRIEEVYFSSHDSDDRRSELNLLL